MLHSGSKCHLPFPHLSISDGHFGLGWFFSVYSNPHKIGTPSVSFIALNFKKIPRTRLGSQKHRNFTIPPALFFFCYGPRKQRNCKLEEKKKGIISTDLVRNWTVKHMDSVSRPTTFLFKTDQVVSLTLELLVSSGYLSYILIMTRA